MIVSTLFREIDVLPNLIKNSYQLFEGAIGLGAPS